MFRVIIAGGRDFRDYDLLAKTMNHLLSNVRDEITVVCGKARGADTLGEQYAKEHGYSVQYFPADWNKYGKSAGYLRNTEMAKNADALVAFWNGASLGTRQRSFLFLSVTQTSQPPCRFAAVHTRFPATAFRPRQK